MVSARGVCCRVAPQEKQQPVQPWSWYKGRLRSSSSRASSWNQNPDVCKSSLLPKEAALRHSHCFPSLPFPSIFPLHAKLPSCASSFLLLINSHQQHVFPIDVSIPCSAKPSQVLGSSKWLVSQDYLCSSQRQALNTWQCSVPPRYQIHITCLQYGLCTPGPSHQWGTTSKSSERFRLIFNSLVFVIPPSMVWDSQCKENILQMTYACYSWETFLFGQRHKCRNDGAGNHRTAPISACESLVQLPSKSKHSYLFVKTLQTNSNVSEITGIPISFLGPFFPTSQPQADCTFKGNVRPPVRKSQKGSLLLESVARTPLGKEKSWSWKTADNPSLTASSSSLPYAPLLPFSFFSPPGFFSAEGLVAPFHPTHLQLRSRPIWGHLLCPHARPQARWPLSLLLALPLPDPLQTGRSPLPPTRGLQIPHLSWRLPAAKPIGAGGTLSDRLCSYTSSFLSIFLFFAFSPALAQGAAPLCQQGVSQHRPVGAGGTTAKGHAKPT